VISTATCQLEARKTLDILSRQGIIFAFHKEREEEAWKLLAQGPKLFVTPLGGKRW
jgi:hypothetical protein